jgi:ribosomal-protein-alanine N-acetyltransferase
MIEIRDMALIDVPSLVGLEKKLFPESPWSAFQFKEELAGVPKTHKYLVATTNGEIIGYSGIALAGDVADIHTIAVLPEFRNQGIASLMLDQLEAWAATKEVSGLMLEMREGNIEAQPLYEKRGYSVISRRDNYYGKGIHALIMRRELVND